MAAAGLLVSSGKHSSFESRCFGCCCYKAQSCVYCKGKRIKTDFLLAVQRRGFFSECVASGERSVGACGQSRLSQRRQSQSFSVEWKAGQPYPAPASPSSQPRKLPSAAYSCRLPHLSVSGTKLQHPVNPKHRPPPINYTPKNPRSMRRNFGSVDLAALDLQSPYQAVEPSLEDRFSALNPSADADADYSVDGSEYSSDEGGCIGFPLERMALPHSDVHSTPQSLQDGADFEMEGDAMSELMLPALSLPSRPRSESGDARASRVLHPTPEIPEHLHEQHLRCLGLKVMLSNLSSSSANANAASKPSYVYPGVNDRSKTALLPIRQPSLQAG